VSTSPLRRLLEDTAAEHGCGRKDLTVISDLTDPFHLDTPAHRRDAQWLANTMTTPGLTPKPLIDSRWSWIEQTQHLIDKRYRHREIRECSP
jgi:hypothetical protein